MGELTNEGRGRLALGVDLTVADSVIQDLARRANHDSLTGLDNRIVLLDSLERSLTRWTMLGEPAAVLFCDLDHFKIVNDTVGHEVGDDVLCVTAQRLVELCRDAEAVARLGGDEFAIVLSGPPATEARTLAQALVDVMRRPVTIGARTVRMSMSVGVAYARDSWTSASDLLRDADTALYQAKSGGRSRVAVFSAADAERMRRAAETEVDLRKAIECDELRMCYQPIIDLASGALIGVEALIRWDHPERGRLLPSDFLGVAEDAGLIEEIDRYALFESVRQLAEWQQHAAAPRMISVNMSGRDFNDYEVPGTVRRALDAASLDPTALCIEITERTMFDTAGDALETMRKLRELGVYLAIDDFGTGYGSLSAVRDLPVEVLKIDRTFVDGIIDDPNDAAVVAAVMSLAHALGMHVIAEGVERPDQARALTSLGCGAAQGYMFAEPLRPPDVVAFCAESADRRRAQYIHQPRVHAKWGERLFIDEFMNQMGIPRGGA